MSEPFLIDVRNVLPREYRQVWRQALWDAHGGVCGVCREPISVETFDVDHVLQRCLGGTDEWDNLRPVHRSCNQRRARGTREERRSVTPVRYRSLYR